ncbi:hypothetical protein [Microbispora sp. H11081]|uniref:hypothetical protein n=1 Tax=Microbispora sp. H11081 TaxID=2729107 RepID=UPI0014733CBB|nr:hypothetical protein [Microbispora sp. H11081]
MSLSKLIVSFAAALIAVPWTGSATGLSSGAEEEPRTIPASAWKTAFSWNDPAIDESSGLYASALHEGVVWTVNDGEGPVRLFAAGPDGRTRAVVTLAGVTGVDTEALGGAVDEDGASWIYVGDIGGVPKPRPDGILVHRFAEPDTLVTQAVPSTTYRLVYPDGQHDAEALLVDPNTRQLYVVTKSDQGGDLYSAPLALSAEGTNPLTHVAKIPQVVSDGLITAKGAVVLRGYNKIRVWDKPGGQVSWVIDLPQQPQGEGLALSADGSALLISSEQPSTPVHRLDLPEELRAEPPWASPRAPRWMWAAGGGGGLAVVLLAGVLLRARRRRGAGLAS